MSIWPWPQQTEKCENQFGGVIFIHKNYLETKIKVFSHGGLHLKKWPVLKGKLGEKIKKKHKMAKNHFSRADFGS